MKTDVQIEDDPQHPEGGHAIVRWGGTVPAGATLLIEALDKADRRRWTVRSPPSRDDAGGTVLCLGEKIVEAIPADLAVTLVIVETGERARLVWPALTPLQRRQRRRTVARQPERRVRTVPAKTQSSPSGARADISPSDDGAAAAETGAADPGNASRTGEPMGSAALEQERVAMQDAEQSTQAPLEETGKRWEETSADERSASAPGTEHSGDADILTQSHQQRSGDQEAEETNASRQTDASRSSEITAPADGATADDVETSARGIHPGADAGTKSDQSPPQEHEAEEAHASQQADASRSSEIAGPADGPTEADVGTRAHGTDDGADTATKSDQPPTEGHPAEATNTLQQTAPSGSTETTAPTDGGSATATASGGEGLAHGDEAKDEVRTNDATKPDDSAEAIDSNSTKKNGKSADSALVPLDTGAKSKARAWPVPRTPATLAAAAAVALVVAGVLFTYLRSRTNPSPAPPEQPPFSSLLPQVPSPAPAKPSWPEKPDKPDQPEPVQPAIRATGSFQVSGLPISLGDQLVDVTRNFPRVQYSAKPGENVRGEINAGSYQISLVFDSQSWGGDIRISDITIRGDFDGSVGGVRIGERLGDVIRKLGPPSSLENAVYRYESKSDTGPVGFDVEFGPNNTASEDRPVVALRFYKRTS